MSDSRKPSIIYTGLPWDHPIVAKLVPDPLAIKKMLEDTVVMIKDAGYPDIQAIWVSEGGLQPIVDALKAKQIDGVIIGAGVRMTPQLTPFLEDMINTVHAASPSTRIYFNTDPPSTLEAVKRCEKAISA